MTEGQKAPEEGVNSDQHGQQGRVLGTHGAWNSWHPVIQSVFQVLSLSKGGEVRKSPDPLPVQLSLISKAFPRWELPR